MTHYYNDFDKHCCNWLRELIKDGLIPAGDVDERSITAVKAHELNGYTQCHFFAGIGGWPLALQLADVPDDEPLWTGSCPCQPFSSAGKQMGDADSRHLFPAFRRLIARCNPPVVFGEQVASPLGREWLARVRVEMATLGYATRASDLCAAGVAAPQLRQRLFWVADTNLQGPQGRSERGNGPGEWAPWSRGVGVLGNDGLTRRAEPGISPVATRLPGRVALIRGSGNSIVPQVGAKFIQAYRGSGVPLSPIEFE